MSMTRELTADDFARSLERSQRERIVNGEIQTGDVVAIRRFVGLTQVEFARAMGISVHTLRDWEQDRRMPEGPALALLRIRRASPQDHQGGRGIRRVKITSQRRRSVIVLAASLES